MNINRGLLIGIVAGVIVSSALAFSSTNTQIDAQMGGMMGGGSSGGGMSHSGDSSSGMMMGGGGGPSRHGVFYGPGTVHQQCHMGGDMPPHYCEPYYKAMSSVKGVKISNVEPLSDKQIRVTLLELSADKPGINSPISVNAGAGPLSGTTMVAGGWSDRTTVDLTLEGTSSIYSHQSRIDGPHKRWKTKRDFASPYSTRAPRPRACPQPF